MRVLTTRLTVAVGVLWSVAAQAEDQSTEPFGPNWSVTENQPCQVWNDGHREFEPFIWSGDCVDGKGSGEGRLTFHGSVYEGEMLLGKKHGWGKFVAPGVYRYEGEWRDGKLHGRGVSTFVDGGRYVGEFRDGWEHGSGTYTYANGGRYVGEWRDGRYHGQGIATWPNDDRYEGEFRDGKKHGYGTYISDIGSIACEWRDGESVDGTCQLRSSAGPERVSP